MFSKKQSETTQAGLDLVARVARALESKRDPQDPRLSDDVEVRDDINPHTADVDMYDLARLLAFVGSGGDHPRSHPGEQIIYSMVTTVSRTRDDLRVEGIGNRVRARRAAWLRWELDQLGVELPSELAEKLQVEEWSAKQLLGDQ